MDGPLAPFADGLRRELAAQGYALDTIVDHVHLLADLSDWLSGRGLTGAGLTSEVAGEFLRDRRARGLRIGVTVRAVMPILGYLRELRVAPPCSAVVAATAQDVLLSEYRRYLESERGLSAAQCRRQATPARGIASLVGITAGSS
ncbi:hypothetical protein ACQP1O_34160 [Nocardia sp. CA-151230]|uniref:hypothetical protein n=1 Tax=Nocardia sp. CA-151230 TaxID=3239982 RepID=UPI003D8B7F08